jgi:hypothetical protein
MLNLILLALVTIGLTSCGTQQMERQSPIVREPTWPTTSKQQQPLSINCAPRLQKGLQALYKLPEVRQLIAKIYEDGPISIDVRNTSLSNGFGAFWDQDNRIICVGITPNSTESDIISSILFELHNAAVSNEINHYDELATRRQISKDDYVESIEYLEYSNSLKASKIAAKGIEQGILPRGSRLHTYRNFDEHYYYQRTSGHSSWIANTYDQLTS